MSIGYVGGKCTKTKFLYKNCPPKEDYKTFVLSFGGMLWLFLNEDFSHCDKVVCNEINPFVINYLKAQTQPEQFLKVFQSYMQEGRELCLDSKSYEEAYDKFYNLYHKWRKELFKKPIDTKKIDFNAAVQYGFLISHSHGARHPEVAGFTYRDGNSEYPNFMKILNKLESKEYTDLLRRVTFEATDFEECFKKYDSINTFFYVDPPYWGCEGAYNVDNDLFGKYGHIRLANAIKNLKGKVLLSYYDFPYIDSFYPPTHFNKVIEEFNVPSLNFEKKRRTGKEILLANYPLNGNINTEHKLNKSITECYLEIARMVCPKRKKRTKKSYKTDFKRVIVDLINLGVKKAELMRRFRIGSYTTLKRWHEKYKASGPESIRKLAA